MDANDNSLKMVGDNDSPSDAFPLGLCEGDWTQMLSVPVIFATLGVEPIQFLGVVGLELLGKTTAMLQFVKI